MCNRLHGMVWREYDGRCGLYNLCLYNDDIWCFYTHRVMYKLVSLSHAAR